LSSIAQAKPAKCERSELGDIGDSRTNHSFSGWIISAVCCDYFKLLWAKIRDKDLLVSILDSYSTHKRQQVLDQIDRLTIRRVFKNPNMTDAFELLDRYMFGCLKAMTRNLFANFDV
jgi:hypothetical protein